jgi:RNA polymerase sigma-70 factor (ECF subfamily)
MADDDTHGVALEPAQLRARLEAHHRDGYAWALSCCGFDRVEAENVLQTSYVKILDGRAVYGGRSSFRTWLFGVIRLTSAQERRRSWFVGRRLVHDEAAMERLACEADPTEPIYRDEMRGHVERALATLPRRQREVIALVFDHELTLEQAAEVMDVSSGAVRQHYDRAKRRMRQWLERAKVIDDERSRSAA